MTLVHIDFTRKAAFQWKPSRNEPMIHRVEFEQWVPVAIEKVFLFFANPNNLPRIMPPETRTEIAALRLVPPPTVPSGQQAIRE